MVLVGLGRGWRQNTTERTEGATNVGEMQTAKTQDTLISPNVHVSVCMLFQTKGTISISFYIKFLPEVQDPLYHTCYVKALQLLL